MEQAAGTDIDMIEARYRYEKRIRYLITTGQRMEIRRLINRREREWDFQSRLPENPLRLEKNMAIVLNSIGRLCAEKGGLPPFLLHRMSEEFAINIETQKSIDGVNRLSREILLKYCDAVYHYGIRNHSAHIVKACQFILQNLHTKLKLRTIAEKARMNPSYLSRRFKEETGQTIWSYIREKRMMKARWLLSQTEESITAIALSLGFENLGYFSKVFHKEQGLSPRDYRQQHWRDDFDGIPGE